MSKLVWDQTGERLFETGISNAVLYPMVDGKYPQGVAWNGLTGFTAKPSGAEPTSHWADNIEYLNIMGSEKFGATIEAFMYPDEFAECNGMKEIAKGVKAGQQRRRPFGFVCKSILGNDTDGVDYGYKLHIVYGGLAAASESGYKTTSEDVEPNTMSWEVSTTPVTVAGCRPTSHLEITSTNCDPDKLASLEAILFGSEEAEARLPLPDEIVTILGAVEA